MKDSGCTWALTPNLRTQNPPNYSGVKPPKTEETTTDNQCFSE